VKRHETTVALDGFGVSSMTGDGKCVAQPTRHFAGLNMKWLHCSMYGKQFNSSDEAHSAMHEHGYSETYYSRRSVPAPVFAKLKGERERCKFDALYRLYKWMGRRGLNRRAVRDRLVRLAARGNFHPAAKQFAV
jgi:hypothetical protein